MEIEAYIKSDLKTERIVDCIEDPKVFKEMSQILYLVLADEKPRDVLVRVMDVAVSITDSDQGMIIAKGDTNEFEYTYICFSGDSKETKNYENEKEFYARSLSRGIGIISNNTQKDPRLTNKQSTNSSSKTMIIPLSDSAIFCLFGDKVKYTVKMFQKIIPLAKISKPLVDKIDCNPRRSLRLAPNNAPKDRFLATMSHELRTPLNGILGMITLIPEAGKLTQKQQEYMRNLTECAVELSGLIGNILDFSKMEENKLELRKEIVSIEGVIQDVVNMVHGSIMDKKIKLDIQMNGKLTVLGDRQRLVQILSNLITNSIKFTEKGGITLTVASETIPGTMMKKIFFSVKDTGIGFPKDEQALIFELFHQAQNRGDYISGTGLGLSIVKKLVEMMGGSIKVSSSGVDGEGSDFSFYIIMQEEQEPLMLSPENKLLVENKRILVIDDKQEIRLQLSDILLKHKCNAHPVPSAKEALEYLNHGFKFDAAIVDICMPNMSGIELAQELKRLHPELPLIGLSSTDKPVGVEWFSIYLFKPIVVNEIIESLIKVLDPSSEDLKPRRKKVSKSKLKIMIAEDDKKNIFVAKEFLKTLGYKSSNIKIVDNGKQAVDEVRKKPKAYHVILMDLIMPVMSGEEATKKIKEMDDPPMIIAVSAAVHPTDKNRYQDAGIDGYLAKPLDMEKLKSALLPLLKE